MAIIILTRIIEDAPVGLTSHRKWSDGSQRHLIDFINLAKNKTWGYFRIYLDNQDRANIDNSCSNSEIYCMFINRGRNVQLTKYAIFNGIIYQNLLDKSTPFILGISISISIR